MSASIESEYISIGSLSDDDIDMDDDERVDLKVAEAIKEMERGCTPIDLCLRDGDISPSATEELARTLRAINPRGSLAFLRVDLSMDQTFEQIFSGMTRGSRISRIALSRCSLGTREAGILARFLDTDSSLRCLNLRGNAFGSDGVKIIAQALGRHPSLFDLNLSDLAIDDEGAAAVAAMIRNIPTLEGVDVSENAITCDGAESLARAIACHRGGDFSLHANGNSIADRGARSLANALLGRVSISALFLKRNNMSDVGVEALLALVYSDESLNTLSDCNHSLGRLCIDENTDVSDEMNRRAYEILTWMEITASLTLDEERECRDPAMRWKLRKAKKVLALLGCNFDIRYFKEVGLELMPDALEKIQSMGCHLSLVYSILRNWKLPILYQGLAQKSLD